MSAAKGTIANENPSDSKPGGKKKKKKSYLKYYIGVPAVLIAVILIYGFMPVTGTIQYGICRTFVESRTIYPLYLDIVSVMERPSDVRVEYTVMNEFGDTLFHTITCVFQPDPEQTLKMTLVILDRKKLDPAEYASFNKAIPAIINNPPDLAVPAPMVGDLMELWKPPTYD